MPGDTLHFQFEALDLESGLYIRNSAGSIVKYNARVMDFGENALGCIEADFSKKSCCSTFEIYKISALLPRSKLKQFPDY